MGSSRDATNVALSRKDHGRIMSLRREHTEKVKEHLPESYRDAVKVSISDFMKVVIDVYEAHRGAKDE